MAESEMFEKGLEVRRAVLGADAIVTVLPTSKHVADAVGAMKDHVPPGALVIEMSSGAPGKTRGLATELAQRGAGLIARWGQHPAVHHLIPA